MNELYCNKLVSSYEGTHPKKEKRILKSSQPNLTETTSIPK